MSDEIPSPRDVGSPSKPLSEADVQGYLSQLNGWSLEQFEGINTLLKHYQFKNFADALTFTNRVGVIAEDADHHPQIVTEWGAVTIRWWSHGLKGLSLLDFAQAKACDSQNL